MWPDAWRCGTTHIGPYHAGSPTRMAQSAAPAREEAIVFHHEGELRAITGYLP
jgi:hypothetical protein